MSGSHLLRNYAHLDSPIHRAPASLKMLATVALVTGVAFVPVALAKWTAVLLVVVLVLVGVAGVPLSAFLARLALVQPFVLGIALLSLFQGKGIDVFIAIALKSTTCVAAVQLLAHTTPFYDQLQVMRHARVPSALVVTLALLYRYFFVLVEESQRMKRARAARTWQTQRWASWRTLSSVIAMSFVRSMARAERIAGAMRARGWS